jgi:hypothetical protein
MTREAAASATSLTIPVEDTTPFCCCYAEGRCALCGLTMRGLCVSPPAAVGLAGKGLLCRALAGGDAGLISFLLVAVLATLLTRVQSQLERP